MPSSSGKSRAAERTRGFPSQCHCGLDVVIFTSTTKQNPGRPFFRCPTRKEGHLFEWVEDCVYEEVVDIVPKLSILQNELNTAKSEVGIKIGQINSRLDELTEDGVRSQGELRKAKRVMNIGFMCFFLTLVAMAVLIFCKSYHHVLVQGL